MNSNKSNPWKIVVVTALGIIAAVLLIRFMFGASSDLQALLIGVGFGTLAGIPIGLLLHPRPKGVTEAYNEGYKRGYAVGEHANRPAFGPCDMTLEVIVPQQQRELVPVVARWVRQ